MAGGIVVRLFARTLMGGLAIGVLGSVGCAGTYDLLTSQRFRDRPFQTMFSSEDPLVVLTTVDDGDARARAMANLREPKRSGGTDAQQDQAIEILRASATTDRRALCRLAAVQALSRFEDPRVVPILMAAYRNAPHDVPPDPSKPVVPAASFGGLGAALSNFTPETVATIQCQALESLGKHRNAEGLQLIVSIVSTSSDTSDNIKAAGGSPSIATGDTDRIDVRLAGIRALGEYKGDRIAAQALIRVLASEKDVALRGRAHESLVRITGEDLPPEASAWSAWMDKKGQ